MVGAEKEVRSACTWRIEMRRFIAATPSWPPPPLWSSISASSLMPSTPPLALISSTACSMPWLIVWPIELACPVMARIAPMAKTGGSLGGSAARLSPKASKASAASAATSVLMICLPRVGPSLPARLAAPRRGSQTARDRLASEVEQRGEGDDRVPGREAEPVLDIRLLLGDIGGKRGIVRELAAGSEVDARLALIENAQVEAELEPARRAARVADAEIGRDAVVFERAGQSADLGGREGVAIDGHIRPGRRADIGAVAVDARARSQMKAAGEGIEIEHGPARA